MIDKIERFILIPPRWTDIKRIGNSNFAKLTILMPFVGYMILFNDNFIRHLDLSAQFVWSDKISNSNRLFYFYFGMSFSGIASLLFQFFCPKQIRIFKDPLDAVEYDMVLVSGRRIQRVMELINANYEKMQKAKDWVPPQTRDFIERLNDAYKEGKLEVPHVQGMAKLLQDDSIIDERYEAQKKFQEKSLHVSWNLYDIVNRKARFLILALYGIGFMLLAIPTVDTFIRVCIAFGDRLFE